MAIEFSDRELDVMTLLWDRGSSTVREAKEEFEQDLAYTSVLSVFQALEEKGYIDHEREGRAYRYFPLVSRAEAQRGALDRVIDRLFQGSPTAALTALLDDESLDEEIARELRKELDGSA